MLCLPVLLSQYVERAYAIDELYTVLKVQERSATELYDAIIRLKRIKKAVLLAHYYQEPAIQDLADFVGDSLGLSQQAAATDADMIVFAGVHFMGETAKIINPTKKVIIPTTDASCSLAESCPPADFRKLLEKHPDHTVVTYINCSAEIKAMSDIICTSSNAVNIINAIPAHRPIIFAPDVNLGKYLIHVTGRDMLLWQGSCLVHEAFSIDKILALHAEYPRAQFIAHPECEPQLLKVASFTGSTTALLRHVEQHPAKEFIVATEAGILHQMRKKVPEKTLIPAPVADNSTCACGECPYMKMNTLEKLYHCLNSESPEIHIPEAIRKKAFLPLQRMLDLSKK